MSTAAMIVRGEFTPRMLRRYVLIEAVIFWGLIGLCWMLYPRENRYSIMTHTFSFLGSFENKHNPQWWWIFSVAMSFWGIANIPLALYARRRFAAISLWGARVGAGLFLLGSMGIISIAIFPDARGAVIGNAEWTEIHEKAAIAVAAGFILGILWHGALLLKDRFLPNGDSGIAHRKLIGPYAFWGIITGTAAFYLISWEFIYTDMKASAALTGAHIGSSWSEALNTRYSFPLWENIVIYTFYAFMAWFTLALPNELPGAQSKRKAPN